MIKVLLASPSYDGRFDVRYVDSLLQTQILCAQNDIHLLPYYLCYDSLIQRVRNDYFRIAYENQIDVLFFIDSDIGWNPQDFIKLVLSDKDMIGGTYRKKTDNEELYAFKSLGENKDTFNIVPDSNGILEVSGLGCGFLKISKNCVTKMVESEKNFYSGETDNNGNIKITKNICECVINTNNYFVSEDIILGYKWQQLGGKVYLDTTINLVHVGVKEYKGNVNQWLQNWKLKFDNESLTHTPTEITNYYKPDINDETFKVL